MYLFHNTADAFLPGNNGLYIKSPGTWTLLYARNNVWAGTDYAMNNYNTGQPTDLDYDDLWNGNSGDLVRWDDTRYDTLAAFTAATNQEAHGLSADPGFTDAAGGDYSLDPASALVDAGVVIPGINDDYVGAAPDIGAYECVEDSFILTATPAGHAIAPGGVATYAIGVQPIGGFTYPVTLIAASPSPSLTLSLAPPIVTPPDQATLTVTDTHPGLALLPGLWYTVPITGTGGGVTSPASVNLLVGGVRVYLPLIVKE
jgi:hypothetical protein